MSWFKRPEVWVMLVLVVAGAGYIAFSGAGAGGGEPSVLGGGRGESDPGGVAGDGPGIGSRIEIASVGITRDFGNARLEIVVDYDNRGGSEIPLAPPDVVLASGAGSEVDPFFLAGDFPDPIAADEKNRATLKFWLQPEHFGGSLVLTVRGESVEVKADQPFDLESVANQESVELEVGTWAH